MGDTQKTAVTGVEMFRKQLDQGMAGDNVGILLRGVDKEAIERGQVIAKPGSITPHTTAKAELYVLLKMRVGVMLPDGYRPQFFFGTADVTGIIKCPEGIEMVMPGDNLTVEIDLGKKIAMEAGQRFAIREGGRTIGAGRVAEVIKYPFTLQFQFSPRALCGPSAILFYDYSP